MAQAIGIKPYSKRKIMAFFWVLLVFSLVFACLGWLLDLRWFVSAGLLYGSVYSFKVVAIDKKDDATMLSLMQFALFGLSIALASGLTMQVIERMR